MPKYTSFNPPKTKKNNTNSLYFSTKDTIVMGILNITNDSFYDGGKYLNNNAIINQVKKMLDEGATIIDIGAQSTRPGATKISAKTEKKALLPVIELLKNIFPNIIISIDTYWSEVAIECVKKGAKIINDISAGEIDEKMFNTIAKLNTPYILTHMQGNPQNMQKKPYYENVKTDICMFFKNKISELKKKGIHNIIIDPGFGFGKTLKHNYQLLDELSIFKKLKLPILIGISRKSMIYNYLKTTPERALNGTSIINTIALQNGANILRVHDVKEAMECIKITKFVKNHY